MKRPAVFMDRDNTLNIDPGYLSAPGRVELFDDVPRSLARLKKQGFLLIVLSNQSGIGRGFFGAEDVEAVNTRINELLSPEGLIDAFYYCPHAPEEQCGCRKPAIGLLEQACADYDIELSRSFMIGDKRSDILLGRAAGIPAVLIHHHCPILCPEAQAAVASFEEAVDWILSQALFKDNS
ncbi:MAG TPA: HAD family hydrolase [Firmicutes bacterium]|nr:HAD family hydrolase [Bacillota bacterium]